MPEVILTVAKHRIFDNYKQSLLADTIAASKCTIDKYLIDYCTLQLYLTKRIPLQYKTLYKLIQLLSSQNVQELCNLGKYSKNAFVIRKFHV